MRVLKVEPQRGIWEKNLHFNQNEKPIRRMYLDRYLSYYPPKIPCQRSLLQWTSNSWQFALCTLQFAVYGPIFWMLWICDQWGCMFVTWGNNDLGALCYWMLMVNNFRSPKKWLIVINFTWYLGQLDLVLFLCMDALT